MIDGATSVSELGIPPSGAEFSATPKDFSSLSAGIEAAIADLPSQSPTKEDALLYESERQLLTHMQERIKAAGSNTEVTLITAQDFHTHFPTEEAKTKALHHLAKSLVQWDTSNYPMRYFTGVADKAANDEATAHMQGITIKSTSPAPTIDHPQQRKATMWSMPAKGNPKVEITFARPGQLTDPKTPLIKGYRK